MHSGVKPQLLIRLSRKKLITSWPAKEIRSACIWMWNICLPNSSLRNDHQICLITSKRRMKGMGDEKGAKYGLPHSSIHFVTVSAGQSSNRSPECAPSARLLVKRRRKRGSTFRVLSAMLNGSHTQSAVTGVSKTNHIGCLMSS